MSRNRHRAIDDLDLERADRPWKPGTGLKDEARVGHLLHMPVRRIAPPSLAPEPVDVMYVLGRPLAEWEMYLVIEARQQERARELVLLAGIGPS